MDLVTQPLALRSAAEQAMLLRTKQASSRELLDGYLERIERLNPSVKFVLPAIDRLKRGVSCFKVILLGLGR